ncbi:unnamed protein product [Rotaria magnacalcarata]|uniref:Uncharacterized protein n=1 Tax=Rotaria magnacalcarata TaxID=392030 RepID=A0A819WNR5_9BILA|nr:unnamed protein product [Rotaria magnacalcarata]
MNTNNQQDRENFSSTEVNSMRNLTKRKRHISVQDIKSNTRIPKSTSSISVTQPKLKKMKRRINLNIPATTTIMNNTAYKQYRRPLYLIRSPMAIIKMLTNIINCNFKKKEEQLYICHRLDLFDKHYYLQVHQQLWQSYLDIGMQQHRWPNQMYAMAKTNDFQICQQYLDNYINTMKKEIDTCHIQLNNQAQSYPLTTLSLDRLDHYLKEFVDSQRKYLSTRNNKQLQKFIDDFHEKQLFETISTYHFTIIDQQPTNEYTRKPGNNLRRSFNVRNASFMQIFTKNFDQLEECIAPMIYSPLNNDRKIIDVRNKRYKIIQETKRPSCIRINQSPNRPRHQQEIAIQKDHKNIYDKVRSHLSEHYFIPMIATVLKQFLNQLLHDLNSSYFSPLSYHDQILTLNQAKKRKEFDKKAQNFFQDTNAFIELKDNPFNKIQDNVIHLLNQIRTKKIIFQWQCNKMMPNRIKCQLAHLYFNPKTHKDDIPVPPIENTIHAPTTNISNYLDDIIRPIFDKECQNTTIILCILVSFRVLLGGG